VIYPPRRGLRAPRVGGPERSLREDLQGRDSARIGGNPEVALPAAVPQDEGEDVTRGRDPSRGGTTGDSRGGTSDRAVASVPDSGRGRPSRAETGASERPSRRPQWAQDPGLSGGAVPGTVFRDVPQSIRKC